MNFNIPLIKYLKTKIKFYLTNYTRSQDNVSEWDDMLSPNCWSMDSEHFVYLYHSKNKLIFNEMMMGSALY
jgi:hypothetical protein